MPDLQKTRKQLKIALAAMVVADVVAAGILFSPLVGSAASRQVQLNQLFVEYRKKTQDVEPMRNMPQKISTAKDQISDFYKGRFAARDSDLVTELGKIAKEQRAADLDVWQVSLVNPDFAAYAELCGGRGFRVASRDELDGALTAALSTDGPSLVHVRSDVDLV